MSEREDGTMGVQDQAAPAADDGQRAGRVVLRTVQVVVLDYLTPQGVKMLRDAIGEIASREAYVTVGVRPGPQGAAIEAVAGKSGQRGNSPGVYREIPASSWFAMVRHVEPPL